MEITTKQITRNLKLKLAKKFLPIAAELRKEGNSDYEIVKCFNDFIKTETLRFYKKKHQPENIKTYIEKALEPKADSKIELIYFEIFKTLKYKVNNLWLIAKSTHHDMDHLHIFLEKEQFLLKGG